MTALGLDTQWRVLAVSTASATTSSASPTATTASGTEGDIKELLKCAPCGKEQCSFEPSASLVLLYIGLT